MKKTLLSILLILVTTLTACGDNRSTDTCPCGCMSIVHDTNAADEDIETVSIVTTTDEEVDTLADEKTITDEDSTSDDETVSDKDTRLDDSIADEEESEKEKEAEEKLYQKAKKMYLSGEWDGDSITLEGHEISLSDTSGCLLLDKYLFSGHYNQEALDLPESLYLGGGNFNSNMEYILGQGMYMIEGQRLIKYVREKKVKLKGEKLSWKGYDPENPGEYKNLDQEMLYNYYPHLYYVPEADTLLMVTSDPVTEKNFLYTFPDYNKSEIKLLGKISDFIVWHEDGKDHFYYTDLKGKKWEYTRGGPKRVKKNNK